LHGSLGFLRDLARILAKILAFVVQGPSKQGTRLTWATASVAQVSKFPKCVSLQEGCGAVCCFLFASKSVFRSLWQAFALEFFHVFVPLVHKHLRDDRDCTVASRTALPRRDDFSVFNLRNPRPSKDEINAKLEKQPRDRQQQKKTGWAPSRTDLNKDVRVWSTFRGELEGWAGKWGTTNKKRQTKGPQEPNHKAKDREARQAQGRQTKNLYRLWRGKNGFTCLPQATVVLHPSAMPFRTPQKNAHVVGRGWNAF